MAIRPQQDRRLPAGPISAGYRAVVLHRALRLESIAEAALADVWKYSDAARPIS